MPFVKCSVDGCSTKLQPISKLDPRDRETWEYRECDICFRPACEKHSTEIDGQIICDRCRREMDAEQPPFIDLGTDRLPVRTLDQPIQVETLANHPEWVALLARWHVAEWHWLYDDWTPEIAAGELSRQNDPNRIPTTLVAVEAREPVGSVSLLEEDLAGWEHLTPWLASLYVRPDCRGRGIGKQLVRHAANEARRMKVAQLYLFTPAHRDFYAALGWAFVTEAVATGQAVTIMSVRLDESTT